MNKKYIWIALILIVFIGGFLRLYDLDELPPGLYPDEAMNGNNALEVLRTGDVKVFYPENNGREGLYMNIQAISLAVFGNEPWSARLPSAIFGILTVLGIYFLTKEMISGVADVARVGSNESRNKKNSWIKYRPEIIALLSALALATSFWHINFSRIGFRAIMAPFFLVWAVYFFLLSLRQRETTWHSVALAGISGLFLGGGMHSYIAYRGMPLLFAIFLPFFFRDKKFWYSIVITAIFALLVASPLFIYYAQNPADFLGRTSQVSIFSSDSPLANLGENVLRTIGMFFFLGDGNWRHNISGAPALPPPLAILFALGVILGIRKIVTNNTERLSFYILFGWLVLASLPVVISNEGIPHALRAILMIPPVMIITAYSAVWLYETISHFARNPNRKAWLRAVIMAFVLWLPVQAYTAYFVIWGESPHTPGAFNENYVELGREINALPNEEPKYIIVEAGGVPARGIPVPAQTVMFITDSFTEEGQKEKNIHYILPGSTEDIPEKARVFVIE